MTTTMSGPAARSGPAATAALDAHYWPLIGGVFESGTVETFPAIDAATGEHLADVTRGSADDIDNAVAAAKAAFPAWAATTLEERSAMLLELARVIEASLGV